jgi:elongation factor Ts
MPDVSAKDVAALRKKTGAGMMDCKRALEETGGDVDAAMDWLRERNLAGAGKRADRSANEGAVEVAVEGDVGAIVELTAETDFVAKGDDFQSLLAGITDAVISHGTESVGTVDYDGGTVDEAVTQLSGKLGEKIEIGRLIRFEASPDSLLDGYKHTQADRGVIGVLVELGGVDPSNDAAREVAHDLALHVANSAPRWRTRDEVPADVIAKEREVLETITRNEGKPEQALPKIVEGRLNGFFKENVLEEQPFVKDPKTTVGKLVAALGADAGVRRYARVRIGEGDGG